VGDETFKSDNSTIHKMNSSIIFTMETKSILAFFVLRSASKKGDYTKR